MIPRAVHTIVVAYHAADELDRCLAALGPDIEVTVVDNSSSEAVSAAVSQHGAAYINPAQNLGFGAGVNVALREIAAGQPQDVLLLNPDAAVTNGDVQALAEYLHRPGYQRVAAVSPGLVDGDGESQRVEWPFPTPGGAWLEAVGLSSCRRDGPTFVIGAVLLLRWEAIIDVGLFDERFFLYSEETDWQRRATDLGWRSKVHPEVVATHRGAGSSANYARREALFHAGQETYIRKWHGTVGWAIYRAAALSGSAVRAIVLPGVRRSAARRRVAIYLRGPRRCAFGE